MLPTQQQIGVIINTQGLKYLLETIIDKESLVTVLVAISEICAEKSVHVKESYNDATLSKLWENAGNEILKSCKNIKC